MTMIDHHECTGGPHYDAALFVMPGRLAFLCDGGGGGGGKSKGVKTSGKGKQRYKGSTNMAGVMQDMAKRKQGSMMAEMPKVPKYEFPEIKMPELPPPPVPAPNQTVTNDQGYAEDDARSSALRRRGLASRSTIFAGPGGYKPKAATATLGGSGGVGTGYQTTMG